MSFRHRYGEIPAAVTRWEVSSGEELVCHKNLPYHLGPTWYKEDWRATVDNDWRYEPIGSAHRSPRRNETKSGDGGKIQAMVDDEELHWEFYAHATQVLQLSDSVR